MSEQGASLDDRRGEELNVAGMQGGSGEPAYRCAGVTEEEMQISSYVDAKENNE